MYRDDASGCWWITLRNLDKGAVVALPYGVEGFATPKHLVKEDGSQAQLDEKLEFKVIEFNKDAKRIILSHSRIFEDAAKAEERAEKKAATKKSTGKREDVAPAIQNQAAIRLFWMNRLPS
jgi:small subunit ribosomal protein S1